MHQRLVDHGPSDSRLSHKCENYRLANEWDDNNYIWHSGGDPGVQTISVLDKRTNLGYICFSNTNTFSGNKVCEAQKIMIRSAPLLLSEHQ